MASAVEADAWAAALGAAEEAVYVALEAAHLGEEAVEDGVQSQPHVPTQAAVWAVALAAATWGAGPHPEEAPVLAQAWGLA